MALGHIDRARGQRILWPGVDRQRRRHGIGAVGQTDDVSGRAGVRMGEVAKLGFQPIEETEREIKQQQRHKQWRN